MGQVLGWGHRYGAVRPDNFRVAYEINPFMDVADQPDPVRAAEQWDEMVTTLERLGASVEVLAQRADAPDMVYAMNLGLAATVHGQPRVVLSHMRHPERRMEQRSSAPWFADLGFAASWVGRDGVGGHLEAGDMFPFGDALLAGYGPRSDELGLKGLALELGVLRCF